MPALAFAVLGTGFVVASVVVLLLTVRTKLTEVGLLETLVLAAAAATLLMLAYARRPESPRSP